MATAWTLPVIPDKAPESHQLSLTLNSSHDNEALSVAEDEVESEELSAQDRTGGALLVREDQVRTTRALCLHWSLRGPVRSHFGPVGADLSAKGQCRRSRCIACDCAFADKSAPTACALFVRPGGVPLVRKDQVRTTRALCLHWPRRRQARSYETAARRKVIQVVAWIMRSRHASSGFR